jgi:hypothetical protein
MVAVYAQIAQMTGMRARLHAQGIAFRAVVVHAAGRVLRIMSSAFGAIHAAAVALFTVLAVV